MNDGIWPGVDVVPLPYSIHLRSIARIAQVAEEARKWMVAAAQDTPLQKVYTRVPADQAAHWLEACQDAYASSQQWGPSCPLEKEHRQAHIFLVNGMVQAINETITSGADYLSTAGSDRFAQGAHAAGMAARAVAHAQALCTD